MGNRTVDRDNIALDPLSATPSSMSSQVDSLDPSSDPKIDTSDTNISSPSPKPSTSLDHPLPDTVSYILCDIKSRISKSLGRDAPLWKEYPLKEGEWVILEKQLSEQFPENLRYRYFSDTHTFVHEMASIQHETAQNELARLILDRKFEALCQSLGQAETVWWEGLLNIGSSVLKGRDGYSRHHADSCILHVSGHDATILEIAYAQKRAALKKLASFYLDECKVHVKLVIAIDFDYKKRRKVTLMTWRKHGKATKRHEQVLRNENGVLIPGEPLKISILDVSREEHVPPSLRDAVIEISVEEFNKILSRVDIVEESFKEFDARDLADAQSTEKSTISLREGRSSNTASTPIKAVQNPDGGPANGTRSKTKKDPPDLRRSERNRQKQPVRG